MFDYEKHFNQYRANNKLDLELSFNMPEDIKLLTALLILSQKRHSSMQSFWKKGLIMKKLFISFMNWGIPHSIFALNYSAARSAVAYNT